MWDRDGQNCRENFGKLSDSSSVKGSVRAYAMFEPFSTRGYSGGCRGSRRESQAKVWKMSEIIKRECTNYDSRFVMRNRKTHFEQDVRNGQRVSHKRKKEG